MDAPTSNERRRGERRQADRRLPSPQAILEQARREELIALELVARATTVSARRVLRDWRARQLPVTQIGRTVLLPSRLVLSVYFHETPDAIPATAHHSCH